MSKLKSVLNKVEIIQIPENALLDGVVKELRGREMFVDSDVTLDERIYSGDVFEQILGEQSEMGDSPIRINNLKVLDQLNELTLLVTTEYVQITNI
jgi:hypothetical protein